MPTWLNGQKKARLAELAEICNIGTAPELADWRKDQLVPALEHELSTNTTRFSKVAAFDEYYSRRNSPIKKGGNTRGTRLANGDLNSAKRPSRLSEYKDESEASESPLSDDAEEKHPAVMSAHVEQRSPLPLSSPTLTATAVRRPVAAYQQPASAPAPSPYPLPSVSAVAASTGISRTPARAQELPARSAPLPASPAVVADLIEAQTAKFNAEVSQIFRGSRVLEFFDQARLELSQLVGVHLLIILIEFGSLYYRTAVWHYGFDVPNTSRAVHFPDLFYYLTWSWISLFSAWSATSIFIPLAVSYFCNLSLKLKSRNGVDFWRPTYTVDPVIFSLTKGLLAWLVFTQNSRVFGLFSENTVDRLDLALPAGYPGVVIASGAGIILAIWDRVQGEKGWN